MNIYHHFHHRQQQRETRPLATNTAELNHRPLPTTSTSVGPGCPGHLDPDRVLPPLATASDGSKFVPFWKRNQQQPLAHHPAPSQQVLQQQPSTAAPPKRKWLTQAEMGMVSPAVIPLPVPTARTSTTSTTTTTTNTSTTTNNNVGTTVSSSGSGITASSVTGRTFNYNYNNYNHHVHQFNQPPSAQNSKHSPANKPGVGPPNNSALVDQARKHMSWHGRAPAVYARLPVQHQDKEDEETSEEEESTEEEDESSSVPPSPQYGILDLPAKGHRRAQSYPHTASLATRDVGTHRQKKKAHLSPALPKPPAVLVLQTPSHRKGDYTSAYTYEYSLKYDRDMDGCHPHVERKKGRSGHLREEESEDEDESEESEESEDLPPPKKKKSKMKNGEKKSVKAKASKSKAKSRGKPRAKQKKSKSLGSRNEEEESEEDESYEDEEGKENEEENGDEDDEESASDHEVRKKSKKRATEAPKSKKKMPDMSLQLTSMNIKDNQTSRPLPHHRQSRSEDYTWQSQSTMSRNTPGGNSNGWPAGLPRLPRTPGTPADGMPPGSSFAPSSTSPVKQDTGYFDYQPNQQTHAQPYSHPQPGTRPSTRSSQGLYTPTTRTSNLSSTPVSTTSTYSTPATSYSSSASGQPRPLDKEQRYMNLDDPPPVSLRRSPSPGYSSSSHSHSYSRSFPQINVNPPLNYGPSPSSSPPKAYEQIRSRMEQSQAQQVQSQPASQHQSRMQMHPPRPQPQPPEPVRRYTQPLAGSSNFQSSQTFWQEQVQQQQQQQQSPYHPHPSQHRSLPPSGSGGGSVITNSYGTADGYINFQAPVTSAPAPVHVPSVPTRRRDLPPQPAQGRERAQEILKEAMERQTLRAQPVQHQPPLQLQQQQHQPQWRAHPVQPAPHVQQAQQGLQQQPRRPPLPQPSLSQQQYHPQPSHQQHSLQHSQPAVSSIQQYRQPIIQHSPQTQQPQQHPSQHQPNHTSQHPLPQLPPTRPRQQHPLPPRPRPQPQPPQNQRQPQQPIETQQPPQAQKNVYRPSSLPVESPLPVGGRDKVANIPRMGKAASVVGSAGSGYRSGGNMSVSDSDAESLRGPSSHVGPQIAVNVPGDDQGNRDKMGSKSPSVHPASQVSSPQMPVIHVQGKGENPSVPKVQVFGVPDIDLDGPEEDSSNDNGGGLPSISISNETSNDTNNTSQSRLQSQPTPDMRSPQQRAKSAPAFSDRMTGTNVVHSRPQASGLSCGGCGGSIVGRIVSAISVHWHPECFRCSVCNTLLEHVSSYEHEGKPYCHLDYHENFAPRCYHCKTAIVEERFISLDDPALGKRTYHEQHFFCAECGDPFLTPSSEDFENGGGEKRSGELALSGDGEFESDNVGFTVYRSHPYCESCHVRLRFPKCKRCKKSIKDGDRAVEALGGKWCWACFLCESCRKPFENPAFFQRGEKPYCEPCFSVMLRNEV